MKRASKADQNAVRDTTLDLNSPVSPTTKYRQQSKSKTKTFFTLFIAAVFLIIVVTTGLSYYFGISVQEEQLQVAEYVNELLSQSSSGKAGQIPVDSSPHVTTKKDELNVTVVLSAESAHTASNIKKIGA